MNNRSLISMGAIAALSVLALGQPALAAEAPPPADSMVVVRDATTGELRAPTAEELAQLKASQVGKTSDRAARGQSQNKPRPLMTHASGAKGAPARDDMVGSLVAKVRADGTLETTCYESKKEVEEAFQSAAQPAQSTSEK